jgi:hypothetical protein
MVQAMAIHSTDRGGFDARMMAGELAGQQTQLAPAWHP